MAAPPSIRAFSAEAFRGAPPWFIQFLVALNGVLTSITDALSQGLTRGENFRAGERLGFTFRTATTLAATWPVKVKHDLPDRPNHVEVGQLQREDGAVIQDPWSMTWKPATGGFIALTFQGLDADTKYTCNLTWE